MMRERGVFFESASWIVLLPSPWSNSNIAARPLKGRVYICIYIPIPQEGRSVLVISKMPSLQFQCCMTNLVCREELSQKYAKALDLGHATKKSREKKTKWFGRPQVASRS